MVCSDVHTHVLRISKLSQVLRSTECGSHLMMVMMVIMLTEGHRILT